ncbi:MAG: DUF1015 family protein [Gemmatimonadota bacterium]
MRFHPFSSLLPAPGLAAEVAAPPYDVVNREEARKLALDNPASFLHVGRSDIDLPNDVDAYDPRVYTGARDALRRLEREGILRRDSSPGIYLYRLIMNGRSQTGVVGCVHIDDYENDVIKKHERTRPDKEDDRTRHVLTLKANAEPVFLTFHDTRQLREQTQADIGAEPLFDFESSDGVRHTGWRVPRSEAYVAAFGDVSAAYVADGHHRCASAWRAGRELRAANPGDSGTEEYNWFLAVLFPKSELGILPYNRVVRDLAGLKGPEFLTRLAQVATVTPNGTATPPRSGTFCLYLDRQWSLVEFDPRSIDLNDPLASLDASLIQDRVLGPILSIGDPRTDRRIDFVGGIRGTAELERRVDSGEMAAGFSLYPTTMDQLLRVADAGLMMPPKSTWFEPKLKSGLFVHTID